MKIKNFNKGTLITKHNQIEYVINKDLCFFNDVKEVRDEMMNEEINQNNIYFPLKDIKEAENYYTFEYTIENEYSNLRSIKNESRTLKLSLLDYLLEINPLAHNYTVLDPNNIFYKNIEDIKIGFRGHEWLPKEESSDLEQYKLIILGTVSKHSFSKYKANKYQLLHKEKDTFLHSVNNAESFKILKKIVREELNRVETEHLLSEEERNRKNKRVRNISIVSSAFLFLIITVVTIAAIKNNLETDLQHEFLLAEELQADNTIYRDLYTGNYEAAIQSMEDSESFNEDDIVNAFQEGELYEELLLHDNQYTSYVIEELRDKEETEIIRELAFSYENNLVLQNELAILDVDLTYLMSANLDSMYDEQMERVAFLMLENEYYQLPQDINEIIESDRLQVALWEDEIDRLETEKEDIDDEAQENIIDDDIQEIQNELNQIKIPLLESDIEDLEESLNDAEESEIEAIEYQINLNQIDLIESQLNQLLQQREETENEDEVNDINNQINSLENQLEELNNQVEEYEEENPEDNSDSDEEGEDSEEED